VSPPPAPTADLPQYGGTLTISTTVSPRSKDFPGINTNEQFMAQDWTRGPAGSNLNDFNAGAHALEDSMMPIVAESWEMPAQGVWILNIRQGVHWAKTPYPASTVLNGREMTAKDVVDSFNWQINEMPKSWIWVSQPPIAKASSINQTGPWQVTIKTPVDYLTSWTWLIQGAGYHRIYAVDVEKKYNHQLIYQGDGWPFQEYIGTGPWIRTEVVDGSLIKEIKNPDYWDKDPAGPGKGNQVPYIDTVRTLYITDRSTQLAALRTGKIDYLGNFTRDEWNRESQLTPRLMSASSLSDTTGNRVFFMRTDKKDKPFADVRVRQAMMMATDFNVIKDQYYSGAAEIDVWPLNSNFKATAYTPLKDMPKSVQDLYTYNPDKAKELLKAAGYPNGFKTSVVVTNVGSDVDDVSIFKDMWKKVGIELVIDIRESSTYSTIQATKNFEDMLYRFNYSNFPQDFYFTSRRGGSSNNLSFINDPPGTDPVIEEAFKKTDTAMMVDMPTVYKVMKELRPYVMESATVIPRPTPFGYTAWQPWLKNYYGFIATGWKYHWIDQTLKKSLGY
jgi:peptide/nickel transport system substrate-binding protein